MSKLQRMKKQKEIAKQEHKAQAAEKLKEVGMEFVDEELPPDEVDEKEVRRSLLTSLRTFIPYTNEWYEAMAAEEEMDDLTKIRIERVKAQDLYTLTKIGRHDEALDAMMAETNHDFFFFNKLKHKMEQEGKWKFDFSKGGLFGDARNLHRNRLRKAANAVYGALDASVTDELARLSNAEAKAAKRYDQDGPCNWRGKNKDGEAMKCENRRMLKPPHPDDPPRKKNDPPEVLACCRYHTPFCVSDIHELRAQVKIKVPNDEALCSECYMMKRGKKPPPLIATIVPGAVPTALARAQSAGPPTSSGAIALYDDPSLGDDSHALSPAGEARRKKHANRCTWQPHPDNTKARGYECCNDRLVHPLHDLKLPTCAWHCTACVRDHTGGSSSAITVPNEYALCAQHYLAEMGHPVKAPPFPYPGMQLKLARDHWKGKRHFAVPKEDPPPDLMLTEYEEPDPPSDFVDKMVHYVKNQMFQRRKRRLGNEMATRIQALYRGYRSRRIHINIRYLRAKYDRLIAAVRIQTMARRYFGACIVHARRLLYRRSATHIQRTWRGYWCRKLLHIDWAARRIARFMKRLHFFKFRDAVILIMQLRRLFKKRMTLAVRIQRVFRGFSTRKFVFHKRYWNLVRRSFVHKIQRAFRQYLIRKAIVPWNPPGEDWALAQCAKRLSRMLLEMYLDKERRRELARLMQHSAEPVQRLVRGFLGRAGTKKMAFLRRALRNWVQPRVAGDFMEKYLNSRLFFVRQPSLAVVLKKDDRVVNPHHIRQYLPEDRRNRFEVDYRTFDPAIEQWYKSKNMVLLKSENVALLRKFRNPMNGNIQIKALDEFIENHKLPCRKHGRFLCGDCVYRKNCQLAHCKCLRFKSSTEDGHGICVHCDHPGSLHSICPIQVRHANRKHKVSQLVEILTAEREPDMSFPVGVQGVAAESVIRPPQSADDRRELRTRELTRRKKKEHLATITDSRTLTRSLTLLETEGDTVHSNNQYWGVHPASAVAPTENHDNPRDIAIFDPVDYDYRPPDYQVSQAQFWTLTAKNPNKTVRDYHEKFEHNMPMPVVKDEEIVYTFEGPQIYFNLLNQIIRMEDHVHYDDTDFLKLVVDHVQIFERHWRKMVADIRTGKLDRHLQIAPESRTIFEHANFPRPQLARRLDETFRRLGFHMKVLGKDIQIRPYAAKKKVGIFAEAVKPRRKRSLPTNALSSTPLTPLSRELSPPGQGAPTLSTATQDLTGSLTNAHGRLPLRFDDSAATAAAVGGYTKLPSLTRSPSSPQLLKKRAGSMLVRSPSMMLTKVGESSKNLLPRGDADSDSLNQSPARRRQSKTKREVLASLGVALQLLSSTTGTDITIDPTAMPGTTPSRGGTANEDTGRPWRHKEATLAPVAKPVRKRRGSHSEVVSRPITSHELNAVHYSIDTAARENYKHAIKMDGDRFVCPFPACGKSFHSRDAAFRHLPVHEQRTRLYAPTPLPDSHLSFYWPEGVPWLGADKYATRALPPGSLACTVPGCSEVFSTQMQFEAHLRNAHRIVGPSSASHGYFELVGHPTFVPPDRPPSYVPLHWCPLHSLPLGSCTVCVRIDAAKGPKQPFRFYNAVKVNFRVRKALKLNSPSLHAAPQEDEVLLKYSETELGVVVNPKQRVGTDGPQAGLTSHDRLQRRGSTVGTSNPLQRRGSTLGKLRRTDTASSTSTQGGKGAATTTGSTAGAGAGSVTSEWRGRPVAYLTDRNENGWVAVEVLYSYQEAVQKGFTVPLGFNKRYQLYRPLQQFVSIDAEGMVDLGELEIYDTAAQEEFERYVRWVPIHMIERTFDLTLCITQDEVDAVLSNVPPMLLRNRFFVSHDDVE